MKTLLLIFIFALSLKADTIYNLKCVKDFHVYKNGLSSTISLFYTNGTTENISYSDSVLTFLIGGLDKFETSTLQNGISTLVTCTPKTTNYNYLGLTENQFNISMAFYGIFLSSLIAFGLIKAF